MSRVEVRMKMQFCCDAATCRVVNIYDISKDSGNFIFRIMMYKSLEFR